MPPSNIRNRRKQRARRGRLYLFATVILIIAAIVSYSVWASMQPPTKADTVSPGGPSSSPKETVTTCPTETPVTNATGVVVGAVYAKLNTTKGIIEVQLLPQYAPKTVINFVNLAESGFYNNLIWHRIMPGFVIQTGDPITRNDEGARSMWGQCGSALAVPFESNSTLHNAAGYLGMASTAAYAGGTSQFYINLADNSGPPNSLDGKYAVFGKVISGMDVVNAIANVPTNTSNNQPTTPIYLISVTISNSP